VSGWGSSDNVRRAALFADVILPRIAGNASILEIGAGEGALAAILTQAGHRVIAIDANPRGTFPAIETTFEDYDAGRERFDCVAIQFVLHHAADLDTFVAKMAGLLTPRGIVAIDDYGWERSSDESFRTDRAEFHTSERMLSVLDRTFRRIAYADHAYAPAESTDDRLAFYFVGACR
jgi:2-polyprenyl-3-methyl-5-hydroxy-6-metoxy-1,4-benzoquinol methylase